MIAVKQLFNRKFVKYSKGKLLPAFLVVVIILSMIPISVNAQEYGTIILEKGESSRTADNNATVVTFSYNINGVADDVIRFDYFCGGGVGPNFIVLGKFSCTYPDPGGTFRVRISGTGEGGVELVSAFVDITVKLTIDSEGKKIVEIQVIGAGDMAAENPTGDAGGPLSSILVAMFGIISGIIRQVLTWTFSFLILPFLHAATSIHVGTGSCGGGLGGGGLGFLGIACDGWEYVKNIANLFFILFLIVIGLATILRVENYNYKRLLGYLVLMALLVNFSLVIGQAILQVADVAQDAFIGNSREELKGLANDLVLQRKGFLGTTDTTGVWALFQGKSPRGGVDILVGQMIDLAISILGFFVLGAITFFLLVRLVALWVLLIISPFAYVFFIVPATKSMATQWWTQFLKYAFFAPIMFFFMALAIRLSAEKDKILGSLTPADFGSDSPISLSVGLFIFNNLQGLVVLAFLFAGLLVAQKFSIIGAGAIVKLGQKAAALPFLPVVLAGVGAKKLAGAGAGAAAGAFGKYYTRTTGEKARYHEGKGNMGKAAAYRVAAFLNPKAAKETWKRRSAQTEKESYTRPVAEMHDFLNKFMPTEWQYKNGVPVGLGKTTHHGQLAHEAVVADKLKEINSAGPDETDSAIIAVDALQRGNQEEVEAATKHLISTNRQDDTWAHLAQHPEIQLPGRIGIDGKDIFVDDKGDAKEFDQYKFDRFLQRSFTDKFGESTAVSMASSAEEYAEELGKPRQYGMVTTDKDTGKKRFVENEDEKVMEQNRRMNRGDSEAVAKSLEPLLFSGKAGAKLLEGLSPAVVRAYDQGRRYQARSLKLAGLDPSDVRVDNINLNTLKKLIDSNRDFAKAIIKKADFSAEETDTLNMTLAVNFNTPGGFDYGNLFKVQEKK